MNDSLKGKNELKYGTDSFEIDCILTIPTMILMHECVCVCVVYIPKENVSIVFASESRNSR